MVAAEAQIVEISDEVLESIIRRTLPKPDGEITVEDMESLTRLVNGDSTGIHSLSGLEVAKNLEMLYLVGSEPFFQCCIPAVHVDDYSPLAGLSKLTHLSLRGNELVHLELPTGLVSLESLDLSVNALTSIELPNDMTNLTDLDLSSKRSDQSDFSGRAY